MATQALPTIQNTQTDLGALIAAFAGGNGNTSSSGTSSSNVTPAFFNEMQAFLSRMGTSASPYSKEAAVTDMEGVIANIARTALQKELPSITAAPRLAGAYNSTTTDLMRNDLAARTQAEMASAIVQNILNYGQIETGQGNMLANMARTGNSTTAVESGNNQGAGANAQKAAVGQLAANAAGGLLNKLLGGGSNQGITDIMGLADPVWDSSIVNKVLTGNDFFSGGASLDNVVGSLPGYNYGGTSGGITDYMSSIGQASSGGGWLDSLLGGAGDFFSGIGDTIAGWFNEGGKIPGKAPSDRSEDNVTIKARSGEYVVIPEAVQALGEDFFEKINAAFMPKQLKGEAKSKKSDPARTEYATGGMVGWSPEGVRSRATFDTMNNTWNLGSTQDTQAYIESGASDVSEWLNLVDPIKYTPQSQAGSLLAGLNGSRAEDGSFTFNPTYVDGAPSFNPNTAEGQQYLRMSNSMDAGWIREGVAAFMPGDLNFFDHDFSQVRDDNRARQSLSSSDMYKDYRDNLTTTHSNLVNVANALGIDVSQYTNVNFEEDFATGQTYTGKGYETTKSLFDYLNSQLGDFVRHRGASAGWDGQGNMRGTAETLYHRGADGTLTAIAAPKFGQKAEHKGWAKEEGAETIAAIMTLLPAVGGFAGMFGMPASSTGGMLVNAAGNYALTGNPASLIGAAGGLGGGQLASAFGMSQSLGSTIGSNLAKQLYSQSQQKR